MNYSLYHTMLMNKVLRSLFLMLMAVPGLSVQAAWEQTTTIAVGDVVVLAADNGVDTKELAGFSFSNTIYGAAADYDGTPAGAFPLTVEAGTAGGSFAFRTPDGTYLEWSSGNSLTAADAIGAASSWTVEFQEDGTAIVANVATTVRILQYNAGSPRFACYGNSNLTSPIFWKQAADGAVAPPVFKPGSTSFVDPISVEITAQEGATIYYTLDGSEPAYTDSVNYVGVAYQEPIPVDATTTLKAIAVVDGAVSRRAVATYTKLSFTTIADAQASEAGTTVLVEGIIVASAAYGAVLYDGTDYIYYYNTSNKLAAGQLVRMQGVLSSYGGAKQLSSSSIIADMGTGEVEHPEPAVLTAADFDAIRAAEVAVPRRYVSFDATLTVSGNFYNLSVEGAETAVGAIVKPHEDLSGMNGREVRITGYLMYVSGKYVYVVATDVGQTAGIAAVRADERQSANVYNLKGQLVTAAYKGIVVKNGRKYVQR